MHVLKMSHPFVEPRLRPIAVLFLVQVFSAYSSLIRFAYLRVFLTMIAGEENLCGCKSAKLFCLGRASRSLGKEPLV